VKVFWTQTAVEHLDGIHAYISRSSNTYAQRVVDRLTARSAQLADFPESGRKVPEFDLP
jgi:plasmid stabilization system protein ParE